MNKKTSIQIMKRMKIMFDNFFVFIEIKNISLRHSFNIISVQF